MCVECERGILSTGPIEIFECLYRDRSISVHASFTGTIQRSLTSDESKHAFRCRFDVVQGQSPIPPRLKNDYQLDIEIKEEETEIRDGTSQTMKSSIGYENYRWKHSIGGRHLLDHCKSGLGSGKQCKGNHQMKVDS